MTPWLEQAVLLLRKAQQDSVIVQRAVTDEGIADEIIGFHVQQAAEKCLKAVLCLRNTPYRRTHDLQELCDLLADSGETLPQEILDLVEWSPFAVAYRYEDWQEPDSIDRADALKVVEAALAWCAAQFPTV